MPDTRRIVCLANSRKPSGRCVAGLEIAGSDRLGWIRPVSSRPHQEVSEYERQYEDGSDPAVLDTIDVPLIRHVPDAFQQENWLLDPGYYWQKVGVISWRDLLSLPDPVEPLWVDGHSTYHGRNDKIPEHIAAALGSSLRLIHVTSVQLRVFAPGAAFDNPKRRVQARFNHASARYALWVTDPRYERRFLAQPDGTYGLGECFMTISLGEAFDGATYKLGAAIIEGPLY